ncbi:MAG: dTMP kinase [Patescibacteria group bacterium]
MRTNPFPGVFIAVEGIDGSGKSDQVGKTVAWISGRYPKRNILKTHEPQDTGFGARIHNMLAGKELAPQDPLAFQELYVRDRRDHCESVIIPHLKKKNSVVVCDRYFLSTFAYGMAAGASFEDITRLHEEILGDLFFAPNATLLIVADADVALARVRGRVKEDDMEYFEKKEGFMARTARCYEEITGRFPNVYSIPGNGTREEAAAAGQAVLSKLF